MRFMRLFAAVLNAGVVTPRVPACARPCKQTSGWGCPTVHQITAYQHFVDRSRSHKQPLFCCFLDLNGTYDSVPRRVL